MPTNKLPQILLFGDSLTQRGFDPELLGWTASLANAYIRRAEILNRGLSGYNSRWCLKVFPEILDAIDEPLVIVILIGSNDSVLRDENSFQHVPVTEYEANMAEIIRLAQEKCSRVLVISPPTLNVDGYRVHRSETLKRVDRSVASTQMYTDACTAISSKMNVPNIQFPHLGASMFSDGLHFSAQGNSELFKLVTSALHFYFQLSPLMVQPQYPLSTDIQGIAGLGE